MENIWQALCRLLENTRQIIYQSLVRTVLFSNRWSLVKVQQRNIPTLFYKQYSMGEMHMGRGFTNTCFLACMPICMCYMDLQGFLFQAIFLLSQSLRGILIMTLLICKRGPWRRCRREWRAGNMSVCELPGGRMAVAARGAQTDQPWWSNCSIAIDQLQLPGAAVEVWFKGALHHYCE